MVSTCCVGMDSKLEVDVDQLPFQGGCRLFGIPKPKLILRWGGVFMSLSIIVLILRVAVAQDSDMGFFPFKGGPGVPEYHREGWAHHGGKC